MKQEMIKIGETDVPVILDEGVRYYPISYITTKLLLRSGKNTLITKKNREKYADHLKMFVVNFGGKNIQETNCISEEGLKIILQKTQQGRLSVDQRKSQNLLHKHFVR